ncbi:hypothetical protein ACPCBX_06300 [Streptomyces tuirus]|uniref:5,10-methylene-tetrahydrofolate dehydrogenase n=1 Tax=Streptomyces tuirus TaxID=68278 RepID=A0A7G1N9C5_9ACTN|nr:hypothetical protein [Streptomyces tuirus]BCL18270.1 hypothetical protein GCM10017668_01130 [Streptomyces tuirus]
MTDSRPAAATVRIVLVADPGVASEIAQGLAEELPQQLRRRVRADIDWQVTARTAPLVADEQLEVSSVTDVVRPFLPEGDWDVGVFLTDLPRRAGLEPVSIEVSPEDRIALVSLPALGSWRMRQRARHVVADVVGMLTRAHADLVPSPEEAGRLEAAGPGEDDRKRFIVPGLRGHLSLVTGMVRANRPWRLFTTLSRALAGVFATAAFGLINSSAWTISSGMDAGRLIGCSVASLTALTAWIIIDHDLWERPHDSLSRPFSRLYNTVTCVTITFGVLSLYVVLFLTLFGVSQLTLVPSAFGKVIGHKVTVHDYAGLAWFVSSMGMVGGAFGSGLEDDGTVRNAAYGERQRQRWQKLRQEKKVREAKEGES